MAATLAPGHELLLTLFINASKDCLKMKTNKQIQKTKHFRQNNSVISFYRRCMVALVKTRYSTACFQNPNLTSTHHQVKSGYKNSELAMD